MSGLQGVRTCVFDAYGTPFDFASAAACEGVPADRRAALTALWRDKQLQHSWLRSLQERYVDFWRVTGDALDYALDRLGLAAAEVSFQSSNAWDTHAASDFGMRDVWCNRYGQRRERLPGAPDFEIRSLDELPALLGVAAI
jgi:FMN phosphatase YigB (HAD superfamily)